MDKKILIENLSRVERTASASKISRMLLHPLKYLHAILFREAIYKRTKKSKEVKSRTFFDSKMHLLLPSSTDIYLTGGKSHDSEIRLARFLIQRLNEGDTFVDIGAHYGYFTHLSSTLVGSDGMVYSFEASPVTYKILDKNTQHKDNISSQNLAVSNEVSTLLFYEFPNLYSEYNSLDISQYKSQDWFAEHKPKELEIQSIVIENFLKENNAKPAIIKVDVEGSENKVIQGASTYLSNNSPLLVMEYLSIERDNKVHQEAEKKLRSLGYNPFSIDRAGDLQNVDSILDHLKENNLESDNIVFAKKNYE